MQSIEMFSSLLQQAMVRRIRHPNGQPQVISHWQ
jgi:hypothetical protein